MFLAGCASQQPKSKVTSKEGSVGSIQTVRTTAYTCSEAGGRHSACGTALCGTKGNVKSAASDWSKFPLGTQFKILKTGEVYEICDYGSALVGKKTIDLYKASRCEMRAWGARNVEIQILQWGSAEKSLKLLGPRRHCQYVRSMLADLKRQH